jgi:hypothetical protein
LADPISRYAWILFILVTIANGLIWWKRSKPFVLARPELQAGYRRLVRGWILWGSIPWVVMGIGCTVGGIPNCFQFFRPRDGNYFVLAWWSSILLLIILGTFWMFTGGAEAIAAHPGILNKSFAGEYPSPRGIKVIWCLAMMGWAISAAWMFLNRG